MFVVTWGAAIWLAAALCFMGLASLIFLARPTRTQNRLLALALFLDGLNWTLLAARVAAGSPEIATAAIITQIAFLSASIFAYLAFLGTLETPLTRVLRGPRALVVAAACALVLAGTIVFRPSWYYPDALAPGPDPWRWEPPSLGIAVVGLLLFYILVLVFALAAAIHTWTRARQGTAARSRAGWYAAAFGLRDAVLLVNWISQTLHLAAGTRASQTAWGQVEMVLLPVSFLLFCGLVGYAVLSHQLFDIDLKIKWTLQRGTVAAIYLAVFFIVGTVAQEFLADTFGWALGGVAAGLLIFAIMPLYRFAERLADKAMPDVKDTREYRRVRKRDVYRATLEEMLADGALTAKDRRALLRLQEQLGFDAAIAQRVEIEVLEAGAGP